MEALQWLFVGAAGIAGTGLGAAACHWQMSRTIAVLRARLDRAEQARNGAMERSTKAREHIAQLNQSIADIRKSQSMSVVRPAAASDAAGSAEERRARAEAALAAAAGPASSAAAETFGAFVDTEVLPEQG